MGIQKDIKSLKAIVDSITFDVKLVNEEMDKGHVLHSKAEEKLALFHAGIKQLKINAKTQQYGFSENLKEFLNSSYGIRLKDYFFSQEIIKRWGGYYETIEAKSLMAVFANMQATFKNHTLELHPAKNNSPSNPVWRKGTTTNLGKSSSRKVKKPTVKSETLQEEFDELNFYFHKHLFVPKSKGDYIEQYDPAIIESYNTLKEQYPKLTENAIRTISAFACTFVGIIDTEKIHNESNRMISYKDYLRNTMNKVILRSKKINPK